MNGSELTPTTRHGFGPVETVLDLDPGGPGIDRRMSAAGQRIFSIVSRRRWWILAAIVICEVVALAVNFMTKPVFESTATIELNKSDSNSLGLGIGGQLGGSIGDPAGLTTDIQTEIAILKGDSLALSVIKRLGLANEPPFAKRTDGSIPSTNSAHAAADSGDGEFDPATRTRLLGVFKGNLKISPVGGTRLIKVSFDSRDPAQAAKIANAIIESYKDQYLQSHYEATAEASQWLTQQLSDLRQNVQKSERELTDFEKQSGILSIGAGGGDGSGGNSGVHSVVIQKLDALNNELTAAEAVRIQKEAIYRIASSGNPDVVSSLGSNSMAASSGSAVLAQGGGLSNLDRLRSDRNQLNIQLANAEQIYGANNRHLKDLQVQMNALNAQIRQELAEISARAKGDYEVAVQAEAAIRKQFESQKIEAAAVNEKMVQFAVLSQEASSSKQLYEDLYTKLQEANVSAGIKATNITIVDPARTQISPIRPQKHTNLAFGLLIGLGLGLAAAFAVDGLDRTIVSPAEIEQLSGIPQIGVIPRIASKEVYATPLRGLRKKPEVIAEPSPRALLWMLSDPRSSAAEAARSLRTSIMLSRPGGGPRVILVTSCVPAEGKSTLTMNLAIAFAQQHMRVIVVEADMRRPSMKWSGDGVNTVGLSNVLTGSVQLEDAIQRGLYSETLDFLPAGPRPPMPSEILGANVFDELVKKLRSEYDLVLIDTPPALLVTDAVVISTRVDAVLWVARAGLVTRPQIARAVQIIERSRMPIIGIVVNQMTRELASYGYEFGYDYTYGLYETYYGNGKSDNA